MLRIPSLILLLATAQFASADDLRRVEGSLQVDGVTYASFSGLVGPGGAFTAKASGVFAYEVQISIIPDARSGECLGINVAVRFPGAAGNRSQACRPLELGEMVSVSAGGSAELAFKVTSASP